MFTYKSKSKLIDEATVNEFNLHMALKYYDLLSD